MPDLNQTPGPRHRFALLTLELERPCAEAEIEPLARVIGLHQMPGIRVQVDELEDRNDTDGERFGCGFR